MSEKQSDIITPESIILVVAPYTRIAARIRICGRRSYLYRIGGDHHDNDNHPRAHHAGHPLAMLGPARQVSPDRKRGTTASTTTLTLGGPR